VSSRSEIVSDLARFALFADLTEAQREGVVDQLAVAVFAADDKILRQGFRGAGFYFVLEGECTVHVDGAERARLGRGDFFGEVSVLIGDPPTADVIALTDVRCLVLDPADAEPFLLAHPQVMFRMLQAQARRLRDSNRRRA